MRRATLSAAVAVGWLVVGCTFDWAPPEIDASWHGDAGDARALPLDPPMAGAAAPWDRDTAVPSPSAEAGPEAGPHEATDAGPDAAADANTDAGAPAGHDAGSDMDSGSPIEPDAGGGSTEPSGPCHPSPCHEEAECTELDGGAACSCLAPFVGDGHQCQCPSGTTGDACELDVCGSIIVNSPTHLALYQNCAEVHGDLFIGTQGFEGITAEDFPHLRRVTGRLGVSSWHAQGSGPMLQHLTFSALEVIEGSLEIAWIFEPITVDFPVLTQLSSPTPPEEDDVPFGLQLAQTGVRHLLLPNLRTIYRAVDMFENFELCAVDLRRVETVTGSVGLRSMPNVASSVWSPLIDNAPDTDLEDLGCCILFEDLACEEFNPEWLPSGSCGVPSC